MTDKKEDAELKEVPIGQPILSGRPDSTTNLAVTIVPQFHESHPLYQKESGPGGSSGEYEVTYVLAIPGHYTVQTEFDFDKVLATGDSLLQAPHDASNLYIYICEDELREKTALEAIVGINAMHRLQYIRFRIHAESFADASSQAHDIVSPLLSRWSFQHDIAITTSAVELHQIEVGCRRWSMTVMGAVKGFGDNGGASTPEGRTLLSAFREGMSSHEPLYKALCMFRVIEGSYVLRRRRKNYALQHGMDFRDPGEKLSLSDIVAVNQSIRRGLESAFEPYKGKKYTELRDIFKINIRHAIAHLDLDGNPLAIDSYEDSQKVEQALPVMHHMARSLLATELNNEHVVERVDFEK